MTLLEAHNTGKAYKRPHERAYSRISDEPNGIFFRSRRLSIEDITADDWELEPKSVTVTRADIERAGNRVWANLGHKYFISVAAIEELTKELGL